MLHCAARAVGNGQYVKSRLPLLCLCCMQLQPPTLAPAELKSFDVDNK